jgi:hypothetical protein
MKTQTEVDAAKDKALQDIGECTARGLAEMVAALECDYDRLEELRGIRADWSAENPGRFLDPKDTRSNWGLAMPDEAEELDALSEAAGDCESQDDARERIQEDPLSIEVRSDWHTIDSDPDMNKPAEFCILLGTGGPAVRIIGELNEHGEPTRARLQTQDWFTPWTDYRGDAISSDDLLTYCQQFYFGE